MTSRLALRLASTLLVVLSSTVATRVATQDVVSPVPALVHRFLSRGDEPIRSYRALRRLEGHNARYKKHGWLEAWTSLDPQAGFTYEIVAEGGSGYVRDKVLRKALERELEAHVRSETGAAALNPSNYTFAPELTAEDGVVAIGLTPRRDGPLLLSGTLYLKADDADLVRVEGDLVKRPSLWTRRVHVVRRYGRLGDVRVPLALESTAQIVLAGESSFSMRYEYATINGREVGTPRPRASPEPDATPSRR